jgi:hypothetical protein
MMDRVMTTMKLKGGKSNRFGVKVGRYQSKWKSRDKKELVLGQESLECMDKFCYLGDTTGVGEI